KNGLESWRIMENREPEQNHTPRRQLARPRRGTCSPNTPKPRTSVPLATLDGERSFNKQAKQQEQDLSTFREVNRIK
ncbi:hypothetical protein PIB30_094366, partial [Stylosanthes scabra]|nr:hypothetical protein [Stylosanthes scabra]